VVACTKPVAEGAKRILLHFVWKYASHSWYFCMPSSSCTVMIFFLSHLQSIFASNAPDALSIMVETNILNYTTAYAMLTTYLFITSVDGSWIPLIFSFSFSWSSSTVWRYSCVGMGSPPFINWQELMLSQRDLIHMLNLTAIVAHFSCNLLRCAFSFNASVAGGMIGLKIATTYDIRFLKISLKPILPFFDIIYENLHASYFS